MAKSPKISPSCLNRRHNGSVIDREIGEVLCILHRPVITARCGVEMRLATIEAPAL